MYASVASICKVLEYCSSEQGKIYDASFNMLIFVDVEIFL